MGQVVAAGGTADGGGQNYPSAGAQNIISDADPSLDDLKF